jgi:aspartyl-tRNA(Asn)/glutamyl-tRNA(Gln) amidotransferase subunit A
MLTVSKQPTISEIHQLYREGIAKPSEIIQFFLKRSQEIDPKINSFCSYTESLASELAQKQDVELAEHMFDEILTKQPLFGIPFSVKANILVEGVEANANSQILRGFIAPYSSTVYIRIADAGGILIGVNTMDEFACGGSGETSSYGVTKNPYGIDRVPGGSSSGPVAAVSSGQAVFSLGSDTGGSIRQPAAFCNVVGLKPTYGLVPRWGVIAMASSLDQVGAITQTVEDNLLVTSILCGEDAKDQTTIDSEETKIHLDAIIQGLKKKKRQINLVQSAKPLIIGLPKEFFVDGIDPQIRKALDDLKSKLSKIGHHFKEVSLPMISHAISVYYITMPVELAANLERYDGIRYAQHEDYSELFTQHRRKNFGDEVQRRIMLGTYSSSAGYYDAFYNQAQKVKEVAVREFEKVFEEVDVLLTPTTPEFPFKIGEKSNDPIKMYLSDVFTCGINPVRLPALTVPMGLFDVGDEQLPTGCQLITSELNEDILFILGREVEMLCKTVVE